MDRSSRSCVSKVPPDLESTSSQTDVTEMHRILHPTMSESTFFSSVSGIVSKTDHTVDHKTHLID